MEKKIKKFNETKKFERDYFLDFLKMICIIFVIIHHLFYYLDWYKPGMYSPGNFGFQYYIYQAVPIFMVISGYVWAKSFEKYGCKNLGQAYRPYILLKRFIRLFIPFLVYFFMCFAVAMCIANTRYSNSNWLVLFFLGGPGPEATSSYYVVLLFSMLIVMPLIWILVKKLNIWGVVIVYVVNILFEVLRWGINMDGVVYQFFIFRYIGIIAYGVYLAYNKDKKPIWWLLGLMLAFGATWLSLLYYLDYKWVFMAGMWEWSNICTFPFTMAIMGVLVRYCHMKHKAWGFIGAKTWSIFLIQTFIFAYIDWEQSGIVCPFILSRDIYVQTWITVGLIVAGSIPFYILIEWLATGSVIKLVDKGHKAWLINHKKQVKKATK